MMITTKITIWCDGEGCEKKLPPTSMRSHVHLVLSAHDWRGAITDHYATRHFCPECYEPEKKKYLAKAPTAASVAVSVAEEEPLQDIAVCSECGWRGPAQDCDTKSEGDWEGGFYDIDICPVCPDGGCIDDYDMSKDRRKEWQEWNKNQEQSATKKE